MSFFTDYDPNPVWFMPLLCLMSIFNFAGYTTGMLCLYKVKLVGMQPFYKGIMTMNLIFGVYYVSGPGLIFDFPLCGVHGVGFLSSLGIPLKYLAAIQLSLVVNIGFTTFALFLYRHDTIFRIESVPMWVTYASVSFATMGAFILPHPVNMLVFALQNSTAIKMVACEGVQYACDRVPNFWTDSVLMFSLETSIIQKMFFLYYLFMISILCLWIAFATYRLTFELGKKIQSRATLNMHRSLVRSLVIQTAVQYALFALPTIGMLTFCLAHWDLPGASILFPLSLLSSDFAGVFAMICTHTTYKRAVVKYVTCGKYLSGNGINSAAVSALASSSQGGGPSAANRVSVANRSMNRVVVRLR